MNIQILIKFLVAPVCWIFKVIIEYYSQKEKMKVEQKEASEQREHELKLKDKDLKWKEKDNEIRKFETEEKTKRLSMMLESQREIAKQKLDTQNPNSIIELLAIRKKKKARKIK